MYMFRLYTNAWQMCAVYIYKSYRKVTQPNSKLESVEFIVCARTGHRKGNVLIQCVRYFLSIRRRELKKFFTGGAQTRQLQELYRWRTKVASLNDLRVIRRNYYTRISVHTKSGFALASFSVKCSLCTKD